MGMPRKSLGTALIALLAGCAGAMFTEADQGQTKDVVRGSAFSISLPSVKPAQRAEPKIQGPFIRLTERRVEESSGREVFEFKAEGLGEGDIRIPGPPSSAGRTEPDYVLRVRVKAPEGVPMHVNR